MTNGALADRKEACKTYIEQTKLLVTLASGFLLAPAAALPLIRGSNALLITPGEWRLFVASESAFVLSVLFGYVVLGTITGSQHNGTYNVYGFGTRFFSILQLAAYLAGLGLFAWLSLELLTSKPSPGRQQVSLQWLGDVGPFPTGADCPGAAEASKRLAQVEREIGKTADNLARILVIGSADVQTLKPELRRVFGTNAGLAHARAECIKRLLRPRLEVAYANVYQAPPLHPARHPRGSRQRGILFANWVESSRRSTW